MKIQNMPANLSSIVIVLSFATFDTDGGVTDFKTCLQEKKKKILLFQQVKN